MKLKCYKCKQIYNEEDILPIINAPICPECLRIFLDTYPIPIPKTTLREKIRHLFFSKTFIVLTITLLITLIYTGSVRSDDLTFNMTMYAPSSQILNGSCNGDNYTVPFKCLVNESSYMKITDISKCEKSRTMSHGETYTRDDEQCDIRFTCPECQSDDLVNKTYNIGFEIIKDNTTFKITSLFDNNSWDVNMNQGKHIETEFEIYCPAVRSSDCEYQWSPYNYTDDQASFLFYNYANTVIDQTLTYNNLTKKYLIEWGECKDSNIVLNKQVGTLQERLTQFETCQTERTKCNTDKDNAEIKQKAEIEQLSKDLTHLKEENLGLTKYRTRYWVLMSIFGLVAFVGLLTILYIWASSGGSEE